MYVIVFILNGNMTLTTKNSNNTRIENRKQYKDNSCHNTGKSVIIESKHTDKKMLD